MILDIHPSLTPIENSDFPCYMLCTPILDQRLQSLLNRSPWEVPKPFSYLSPSSCASTQIAVDRPLSCASTQIAIDCFSRMNKRKPRQKKLAPRMPKGRSTVNCISNRLPARSKATIHRLSSTSIAYRLPSRVANLGTQHRIWKPLLHRR